MKRWKIFVSAIIAGCCIGFGAIAFLSVENEIMGAALFTVGLFVICTFELHLFTGKVCYVFRENRDYLFTIPIIWTGNFVGTWLIAQMTGMTRIAGLSARAARLCEGKLSDSLLSIFILAMFCNFFIYVGVEGFKKNPHEIGRYLSLFFGVMVFILCKYEHCIANMFYFSLANVWSGKAFLYLLTMTLGNALGGIAVPALRHQLQK